MVFQTPTTTNLAFTWCRTNIDMALLILRKMPHQVSVHVPDDPLDVAQKDDSPHHTPQGIP